MMNNKLFIPACHKFITKKDGTANFQRIYGVLKSAYSTKYPNDTLSSEEVFDFLKLNQIIPHDFSIQDIDFDYQELCFSIITQYKCNSICQLCPYCPISFQLPDISVYRLWYIRFHISFSDK